MSREIRFRAWTSYPIGMFRWEKAGQAQTIVWHLCGELTDPHILCVMQYTGLKDRDGTDTYEDDIVDHPDGGLCVVKFADGHFYAEDQAPTHCLGFDLD